MTAFFRLLAALGGRAEAPEVLGLVADPAFAEAAGLDADEAAALGADAAAAGITWGYDAAHRAAAGRPEAATHAWEAGTDRLVLGSLLPPPGGAGSTGGGDATLLPPPVGAVVPVDRAANAEAFGRLAGFLGRLKEASEQAAEPADAAGWAARAVDWTESFLADGDDDFGRAAGARGGGEAGRRRGRRRSERSAAAVGLDGGVGPPPRRARRRRPLPTGRDHAVRAGGGAGPAAPRDRVAGPHRRLLPAADGGPGLRPLGAGAPARRPARGRRRSLAAAGVADVGGRPLPRGLRGPRPARPAAAAGGRRRRVARRRGAAARRRASRGGSAGPPPPDARVQPGGLRRGAAGGAGDLRGDARSGASADVESGDNPRFHRRFRWSSTGPARKRGSSLFRCANSSSC